MKICGGVSVSAGKIPKSNKFAFKSKVHIIDGFHHADNMEHFAKASMQKLGNISDIRMHHVDCNRININTKQISDIESTLKSMSYSLKFGDYIAIPSLASVPILNLQDRIRDVLGVNLRLNVYNLKNYKDILLNYLKKIYDNKSYYRSDIRHLDPNGQDLEYTYGLINEINKLREKGIKIYLPAGHGADTTIKWMAKQRGVSDELHRYISTGRDQSGAVKDLFSTADNEKHYNFNLLSLCNAHIVNVKDKNGKNYVFSAKDNFVNDSARGVYNFTPIRNYRGELLGYSYHDEETVEYPYSEYRTNGQIANLCKYVGLPRSRFAASYSEIQKFKEYLRRGYSTSCLPDKLYSLRDVYSISEIKDKKLDTLGTLINRDGLIFDTNSSGQVIFQKTNCEGSERPSVVQMWGSCFSSINAMVRDSREGGAGYLNKKNPGSFDYINQADQKRARGEYDAAERYYNKALNILHPDRTTLNYKEGAIEVYEKLYSILKFNLKYKEAKGVANIIINLKSNEIKNLSVYDLYYMNVQRKIGEYYEDIADYCQREYEYHPAEVCQWAAEELKKSSSYGDKIVQRRAQQKQYIGDLYNECH